MKRRTGRAVNRRQNGISSLIFASTTILLIVVVLIQNKTPKEIVKEPVYVAEYETVEIPVPVEPVSAGTDFNQINLMKVAYPKHQLPSGAITDVGSLRGLMTTVSLPERVPLFRSNFVVSGSLQNPVIKSIPKGMRAMTIKVDATSAVEGWAGSGSVVDVLLIEKNETIVVAENVKIISAERSVAPVEGQVSPSIPSTVTLLVTKEQCLRINTAIPRGKIAFALRSFGDSQDWSQTTFTADKLKKSDSSGQQLVSLSGYLEVKDQSQGSERYSLIGDKWKKISHKPEGFFVGS